MPFGRADDPELDPEVFGPEYPDDGYSDDYYEDDDAAGQLPRLYRRILQDARCALTGRWAKAAAGILALSGIGAVFWLAGRLAGQLLGSSGTLLRYSGGRLLLDERQFLLDLIVLLAAAFILSPLQLGMLRFFDRIIDGEDPDLALLFAPLQSLRDWGQGLRLTLLILFGGGLALGIGALPGILLIAAVRQLPGASGVSAALRIAAVLLGMLLLVIGLLLAIIWMGRLLAAPFLLAEDRKISLMKAVQLSFRASRGFTGELGMLLLSFLPWGLLCILWVPALFVLPYLGTACGIFARFLLEKHANEEQN